jgi:hypothetical protein
MTCIHPTVKPAFVSTFALPFPRAVVREVTRGKTRRISRACPIPRACPTILNSQCPSIFTVYSYVEDFSEMAAGCKGQVTGRQRSPSFSHPFSYPFSHPFSPSFSHQLST